MKMILGNWKMNGVPADLWAWSESFKPQTNNEIGLFLPYPLLNAQPMQFKVGAQDLSRFEGSGAFTGEVSADMLKSMGVSMAMCGHSERRHVMGEGDDLVKTKAENALRAGLHVILCVGEKLETREAGSSNAYVEAQIAASFPANAADGRVTVAYEPVWAIGTGKVAGEDEIAAMHAHIKDVLKRVAPGQNIAIVYGGSVTADNAAAILKTQGVDGVLVGGASLKPGPFQKICEADEA